MFTEFFLSSLNTKTLYQDCYQEFPQTIIKVYQEHFIFETINNIPVNMDYFKRYTAYGFYGLLLNWITNDFKETQDEFIQEVTKSNENAYLFT